MTRGEVLYRDVPQIHGVLKMAIFVPFFLIFSATAAPHAIKAMNLALVLLGAFMIRGIARRWLVNEPSALLAAMIFVFALGRHWAMSPTSAARRRVVSSSRCSCGSLAARSPLLRPAAFTTICTSSYQPTSLASVYSISRMPPAVSRAVVLGTGTLLFAYAALSDGSRLTILRATGWIPAEVQKSRALADAVQAYTCDDDRIFIYQLENLDVFFLSGRLPAAGITMFIDMAEEHMGDVQRERGVLPRSALAVLRTRRRSSGRCARRR